MGKIISMEEALAAAKCLDEGEDVEVWQCQCGCQTFYLRKDGGVQCSECEIEAKMICRIKAPEFIRLRPYCDSKKERDDG